MSVTLWDHVKAITGGKGARYFDSLEDEGKKTWNTFIINRALSMNPDLIELINHLQLYTMSGDMPDEIVYRLYSDLIPNDRRYYKWVKGKKGSDLPDDVLSVVQDTYRVNRKEAVDYLTVLFACDEMSVLESLLASRGTDPKEIKKLLTKTKKLLK